MRTLLESINLLTGKKRAEYSPDGEATVFQLPENNLDQIISVEGTDISYTSDLVKGTVTFQSAPPKGINTIMVVGLSTAGTESFATAQDDLVIRHADIKADAGGKVQGIADFLGQHNAAQRVNGSAHSGISHSSSSFMQSGQIVSAPYSSAPQRQ